MTDSPHTNRSTPKPNEAPKAAGIHPPDQSEIMIRVEGLRFQYGQRVALQDLTLSVARGELFGLLGPNGSGKTTFFRILSTALRPAAGTAAIDGHDLVQNPAAARHRLGVAFQSPSLDGKLSVEENLRYHAYLYGMRGAAMRRRTTVLLERFDLDSRRRERVETLSGGLKRRVELAKALLEVPEDRREALLLHHVWGFTFREVGHMLGISERAAKLRSFRGVQSLRETMGPGGNDG